MVQAKTEAILYNPKTKRSISSVVIPVMVPTTRSDGKVPSPRIQKISNSDQNIILMKINDMPFGVIIFCIMRNFNRISKANEIGKIKNSRLKKYAY